MSLLFFHWFDLLIMFILLFYVSNVESIWFDFRPSSVSFTCTYFWKEKSNRIHLHSIKVSFYFSITAIKCPCCHFNAHLFTVLFIWLCFLLLGAILWRHCMVWMLPSAVARSTTFIGRDRCRQITMAVDVSGLFFIWFNFIFSITHSHFISFTYLKLKIFITSVYAWAYSREREKMNSR